ncbi:MAG: Hsp70 family protein [Myxococcales bacterium]|nr:Hsp70 family protein [Myxococcales bacterium]
MPDDGIILGIDLGTTFSAVAYVDAFGKPVVIPNGEGQRTTASVIHFYERDECVVGDEAVKMVLVDASNVVRFIKRHMGEEGHTTELFGRRYGPQELSSFILRKLKDDAEEALGHPVKNAVITVPAYFNSAQRGATAEAGALAGFSGLSIINEPTAAAIAYGVERKGGDRHLLVFDLGGGTFDVTVMELRGTTLRTIATDGNAELGGKDWDDRLLNHVADQFVQKFGVDPRDEAQTHQELYERCLHAKISLSTKPRAVIPVNFRGHRTIVPVMREEFEDITKDLLGQCADTCGLVLEKAKMSWAEIDDILLTGGSTRMPAVAEMMGRLSGKAPVVGINPDECVALGAALAAVLRHRPQHLAFHNWRSNMLNETNEPGPPETSAPAEPNPGAGTLPGLRIADVASHTLGMVALDVQLNQRVVTLIPEFTPLPCERRGRFAYAYDGMTAVRVEVTEGVGTHPDEVTVIGEVILDNLPPRPRGTPIEVVYRYTMNQLLEVDVTDIETRLSRRARIVLKGALSSEGFDAARTRVAAATVH